MNWINLASVLFALVIGYILGTRRDRHFAILSKKIECVDRLHDRVLEIEKNELSDGTRLTLAVPVVGGAGKRNDPMTDIEIEYLSRLQAWRQQLLEDEDRARLWISSRTVRIVSHYFLLMMHCKSWNDFGKGNLIEDPSFLYYLHSIFGSTRAVLKKVVIIHSTTGEPRILNCVSLSDMCLDVIQQRIRLEMSAPLLFRAMLLWWNFRERQLKRKHAISAALQ